MWPAAAFPGSVGSIERFRRGLLGLTGVVEHGQGVPADPPVMRFEGRLEFGFD
jgi:hypothetical protein